MLLNIVVIALAILAGCNNLQEKKAKEINEIEKIPLNALADASVRLYRNMGLIRYSDTEFYVFENGELACNAL